MKKTTVIFDMDGVIFDSEKMYADELIEFHKKYNIHISYTDCKELIGVDSRVFDDIVYSWWNNRYSQKKVKELLNVYYSSLDRDYTKIVNPHITSLLKYLKKNHYKVALASSSNEQIIHNALTSVNLESYFHLITSGNRFKESKPNPEIYLYTINKLHSLKEETIIIEDSFPGIQAAIRAGIDVIALKEHRFNIDQSQAKAIINNLLDVKLYL